MSNIYVRFDRLESTASKIENACQDYELLVDGLYKDVSKLQSSWSGDDNAAFINQIMEFKRNFNSLAIVMRQYSAFLRASAYSYRETQNEAISSAKRLIV